MAGNASYLYVSIARSKSFAAREGSLSCQLCLSADGTQSDSRSIPLRPRLDTQLFERPRAVKPVYRRYPGPGLARGDIWKHYVDVAVGMVSKLVEQDLYGEGAY